MIGNAYKHRFICLADKFERLVVIRAIFFGSALSSELYGRSGAGLGWTATVYIWCATAAAAVAASVIAGFVWNKKKPE